MRRRRRLSTRLELPLTPADEARIESLWQGACQRGASARGCWVPTDLPAPRTPLASRPQAVVSRHTDFAAWFVGE